MKRLLFGLILALLLLGPPMNRVDASITLDFQGVLNSVDVSRTVDDGANWYSTAAGLFWFKRVSGDLPQLTDIYTFCLEPREFTSYDPVTYNVDPLASSPTNIGGMGEAKANLLRELYGVYYPVSTNAITALKGQALQIATWEIVRETSGTYDVLNGTTQFNPAYGGAALTEAQTYLANILGGNYSLRTDIMAATNGSLSVVGYQDTWVPVPVPAAFWLLGSGLLGLVAIRRRFRK